MRNVIVSVLSTVALCALPTSAAGAPLPIPEQDPFFATPANLSALKPGTIIRTRTIQPKVFEIPVPARGWQLLYRTSDRRGRATVTATTLLMPTLTAGLLRDPRPVVSYQTAEDGVSTRCAPSYAMSAGLQGGLTGSYSEIPLLSSMLLRGWAVAVPDYEGMRSEFLVADVAAKGVLDGLRAVRNFTSAGLSTSPIGMWGYSGGAFATANAAQLQAEYAPELPLKAVALGGLLGDIRATIDAFSGSFAGGAIPMGMHGFDRSYPEMGIRDRLNPYGQRKFDESAADCIFDAVPRTPFLKVEDIEAEPGTLDQTDVATMLRENSPAGRAGVPVAPVYEYHTLLDELAPIGSARAVLRNYCAAGVAVEHRTKLVGEHNTEIGAGAPQAMAFLANRFAGRPPINTCGSIPR
jgi:hypothetical protein